MERLETWIDAAVGETREVLLRAGKPEAIRVARASDEGRRARWGEVYCARVRDVDHRRRGAYLDLGLRDEQGFLPLGDDGRVRCGGKERVVVREGAGVIAHVVREAARGKNPVVELEAVGHDGEDPHRIARHDVDDELVLARPADAALRSKVDAAVEDALARIVPIPGGGMLTIEPTAALVAIDVDAGGRQGSGDPERFALDLNVAAAWEASRQVSLRGLGGLIAVDFVSMRAKSHQKELENVAREAFQQSKWSVQLGGLSRFGVFDFTRAQLRRPLHEIMRDDDGRLSAETVALTALRAIEREARAQTGRQIACTIAPEVKTWLDASEIGWRSELSNRIGMRWTLDAAAPGTFWPRDKIDARAL